MTNPAECLSLACQCKRCVAVRLAWREPCAVCAETIVGTFYMVTDAAWAEAGFEKKQIACFGCFLKRLGRPLALADVPQCPINAVLRWHFDQVARSDSENQRARPTSRVVTGRDRGVAP